MKNKNILVITCTVGYGHDAAAQNVISYLKESNPDAHIHLIDSADFLYPFRQYTAALWNQSVRKGRTLMALIEWVESYYEHFYNLFLGGPLTKRIQTLLSEYPIVEIYDTQPLFTPVIEKACATINPQRDIFYHKIFTDLPTEQTKHFLSSIKQLKHVPHVKFKIHALAPLLKGNDTADSFWQREAKLSANHIDSLYAMPVNAQYLRQPDDINRINADIAPEWVKRYSLNTENHTLLTEPDAKVFTLMLGSQGVDAVYAYCERYIQELKDKSFSQPHYFLIACSRNEKLYKRITRLLDEADTNGHYIIPLKMQPLENIASMMWRSDTVVIRSSGLSCIEQMALREKRKDPPKLFIHSPSSTHGDANALLAATHGWERGNAAYMMQHYQAELTTPYGIKFFT